MFKEHKAGNNDISIKKQKDISKIIDPLVNEQLSFQHVICIVLQLLIHNFRGHGLQES